MKLGNITRESPTDNDEQNHLSLIGAPDDISNVDSMNKSIGALKPLAQGIPSEAGDLAPSDPRDTKKIRTICSSMMDSELMTLLADKGCLDVTNQLILCRCTTFAVAGGGFSDIYQGGLSGGQQVAIKRPRLFLHDDDRSRKMLKRIAREIYIWSKLKHQNVLEMIGPSIFQSKVSIVVPWMENGKLLDYILNNPAVDRYRLCIEMAAGLGYLHSCGVVHGDLKGGNILISSCGTVKLADFGNATMKEYLTIQFTETGNDLAVSMRWAAPELVLGDMHVCTEASDMYALGMTFLETITGRVPFSELKDVAVVCAVIVHGKAPKRPEQLDALEISQATILWEIMLACWAQDITRRPRAAVVHLEVSIFQEHETGEQFHLTAEQLKNGREPLLASKPYKNIALLPGYSLVQEIWARIRVLVLMLLIVGLSHLPHLKYFHIGVYLTFFSAGYTHHSSQGLVQLQGSWDVRNPTAPPAGIDLPYVADHMLCGVPVRLCNQVWPGLIMDSESVAGKLFTTGPQQPVSVSFGSSLVEQRAHPIGRALGVLRKPRTK